MAQETVMVKGQTLSGEDFEASMQKQPTLLRRGFDPRCMGWYEGMCWSIAAVQFSMLASWQPVQNYLVAVLLWRFLYVGFLGYLLGAQSQNPVFLQRLLAKLLRVQSCLRKFKLQIKLNGILSVEHLKFMRANGKGKKSVGPVDLPNCIDTWIFFRNIVDFILPNEALAFGIFSMRLFAPVEGVLDYAAMFGGLLLFAASLAAKSNAYDIIGDYGWYWGDFFYVRKLSEVKLAVTGIYKYFPHAMYTVGYFWYYGCFLMSRNVYVLGLAAFIHLSQYVFLKYVEGPHIKKLYG